MGGIVDIGVQYTQRLQWSNAHLILSQRTKYRIIGSHHIWASQFTARLWVWPLGNLIERISLNCKGVSYLSALHMHMAFVLDHSTDFTTFRRVLLDSACFADIASISGWVERRSIHRGSYCLVSSCEVAPPQFLRNAHIVLWWLGPPALEWEDQSYGLSLQRPSLWLGFAETS